MTTVQSTTIRSLFATRRPIDRPIEKVIDYYATDDQRLLAEVEEYEVTDSIERNFRRFVDVFGAGVRTGQVSETGIWVSGFYGSGKSSFTKYLGFALDPSRLVGGRPFLDLLCERISAVDVRQELRALAIQQPTAVIMLDLGAEQLASSAVATVTTVLYWKVLQWAGYSKEEKVAQLELRLDKEGRLGDFRQAYSDRFGGQWDDIHNDPLVGVARADQIVPQFYPQEFPEQGSFRRLHFSLAGDARDRAKEILELIQRKSGRENVLFLIDEAGQYVAPRGELILNLDGLTRNFKELGRGRVWLAATGQQTLTEIVERAAYNSAELNKLRDRFPVSIELDARDIREITWRRLLTKSTEGESLLSSMYRDKGQALISNTQLTGTQLFKGTLDERSFINLYPFLPQHFDLMLELISSLARSTGGIGLRSAIRVIQDLLVDTSKVLPAGTRVLADMPTGRLATVDQFFDTLRADIGKVMPHVVAGVDRVSRALPGDELASRVAKAIGALQPIERVPRTSENLAALLYSRVGDAPNLDVVREALQRLLADKDLGLVDDPQAGGYTFLSEGVKPLVTKRNTYLPTRAELSVLRSSVLRSIFDPPPSATLDASKTVKAGIRLGQVPIVGEDEEVQLQIEPVDAGSWDERRTTLLAETIGGPEWKKAIAWLIRTEEELDDVLVEVIRSRKVVNETAESEADRDVAQFLRAERRATGVNEDRARSLYRKALQEGTFIFRGKPTPAANAGATVEASGKKVLQEAAREIYPYFHLVNIRPLTDLAAKFLGVERLDRMPKELDPLGFVVTKAGRPRVSVDHPALVEALRLFKEKLDNAGTARLQGNALQDLFAASPYGWSKDATRYVFAALLLAGEVTLFTASGEVSTQGPAAIDALRNTQSFNRIGVGLRGVRPGLETLDRAATRLEQMLGVQVLPLEDQISRAVREHLPPLLDPITPVAHELLLLGVAGADRAQTISDTGRALLQQDGAAAIGILGAKECTFPEDLAWARHVSLALEQGAARDIQAANHVLQEVDGLQALFPEVSVVEPTERELLADLLTSDMFYARLADLRTALGKIRQRAAQLYRDRLTAYEAGLAGARKSLEEVPAWITISPEDRQDLGNQLVGDLPEVPPPDQQISFLQRVLVREATLPGLMEKLRQEVEARAPRAVSGGGVAPEPLDLDLAAILKPTVIGTSDELEAWLDTVRESIRTALEAGAPIRIRVSR